MLWKLFLIIRDDEHSYREKLRCVLVAFLGTQASTFIFIGEVEAFFSVFINYTMLQHYIFRFFSFNEHFLLSQKTNKDASLCCITYS